MILKLGWRLIAHKPLQSTFLILLMALSVSLSVLLFSLGQGVHQGLIRATEPFTLLVGAKGSNNQLVLNTVFLQDQPIGNIPHTELDKLRANAAMVKNAIPLGFGDNYAGFRIVGTEPEIFHVKASPKSPEWLRIKEGRPFEKPFEVVIGKDVATKAKLQIGSTFHSIHGVQEKGKEHDNENFTVVGILEDVGGPYNQAILTDMESIWEAHEHVDEEPKLPTATKALPFATEDEMHHAVTAIMVEPVGYGQAMQLMMQYQHAKEAQLVFPAQVIVKLFAMMGQGEKMWLPVGAILILISLLVMMTSSYLSSLNRLREQAIMVALGASKSFLIQVAFCSQAYLVLAGAALGWIIGISCYAGIASLLQQSMAISLGSVWQWQPAILAILAAIIGLLASIVPAILLHRKSLTQYF